MDKQQLYEAITDRKIKPKDFEPYDGNNGRVNKCAALFRSGVLRSGGTLLDVGGGIGDLGHSVRDLFDRTVCLDISTKNLEAARAKGSLVTRCDVDRDGINLSTSDPHGCAWGSDRDWKWVSEGVDVITALDFIEHIIDPEKFARECYKVLKPGGQVFINTPNIEFWKHLESQVVYGVFPHTSGDKEVYHGGHLSFLNWNDMVNIFGSNGFTNHRQHRDEEGYCHPEQRWIDFRNPQSQKDFVTVCERLGNPNLLFSCEKPE